MSQMKAECASHILFVSLSFYYSLATKSRLQKVDSKNETAYIYQIIKEIWTQYTGLLRKTINREFPGHNILMEFISVLHEFNNFPVSPVYGFSETP